MIPVTVESISQQYGVATILNGKYTNMSQRIYYIEGILKIKGSVLLFKSYYQIIKYRTYMYFEKTF